MFQYHTHELTIADHIRELHAEADQRRLIRAARAAKRDVDAPHPPTRGLSISRFDALRRMVIRLAGA